MIVFKVFGLIFLFALAAKADDEHTWDLTSEEIFKRIPANHVFNWQPMVTPDGKTYMVDANPLEGDLGASPTFSAQKDVSFQLYTRKNPTVPQIIRLYDVDSVKNSNFNPKNPTRYVKINYLFFLDWVS